MRSVASRHRPGVWILLWGVTIAAEMGAILPELAGRGPPPAAWEVALRLVGGSFAACGLVAWRRRPENRSGRLMVATGLSFLAGPLFGQFDAPVMQTLALLLHDLWLVLLVVLLLSFPSGRPLRSATERGLVGVLVFAYAVLGVPWLLFFDYPGNLLAVFADADAAQAIDTVQRALVLGASVGTFAVLTRRWWAATPPLRRAMFPSLAGGVSLLLLAVLLASDIVTGTPTRPVLILTWACVVGLLLTPAAFLTGLLRTRLALGGFADLVVELRGLRGGALQAALARTLRDPTLVLAGWLPEYGAYVDAAGQVVLPPAPDADRSSTVIERDDRPIAMLVHDRSLDAEPEALEAVCAGAALALENEQLHMESRARLGELQASRARIVEAGDAERRRLERNLHDGAQQGLVAVALQLRLIRARADSDPSSVKALAIQAGDNLAVALDELRELARGIHPAVLDHGLTAALESLAARAPVLTTLTVDVAGPLPKPIELAAYFVASEALANVAKYAHATAVTLRVASNGTGVTVEIADNGIGGADASRGSGLRGLADRVEALDGTLRVSSPRGGGTTVSAELPCAS
jgi:signal transduction histidine kinase